MANMGKALRERMERLLVAELINSGSKGQGGVKKLQGCELVRC